MLPEPLHPAVVHFPLVFALVLPVLALIAVWRIHDGAPVRTWGSVTLLAVLAFGAGFVASRTGEAEEDRVEAVLASEEPLHEHEEAAEFFVLLSGVTAGLALLGFAPGLVGRSARVLALLAAIGAAGAVGRAGLLGGELVFRHGAAAAYVDGWAAMAERAGTPAADTTRTDGQGEEDRTLPSLPSLPSLP
jgi:uncharacterized membrane protein